MITKNKVTYFRRLLKKGYPEGELKEQMIREGFDKTDISRVFAPRAYDMRGWYLGFATLFTIIGLCCTIEKKTGLFWVFSALLFAAWTQENRRVNSNKSQESGN